ncbi:hypothetical protein A9P82_00475 [Arachidicoccus ginsenosidimutans]|uniref:hypothetical protein n=1 Tax=Arachidicoccus sp. BS20 TaxID=1850526 RepID=UPI0007F0878B|nr:hypothetical protein [Arachidicoccus sp. BS20]ANI87924.1 hypothetical protein A9P82_00475 [Arachidicoccus sp. BS20]
MNRIVYIFILSVFICGIFSACSKTQDDDFANNVITYKQYLPMQVGAVQLYRLDSTLPTAFGASLTVHSYLAKDSIASQNLDATGDTTFNVYRFITDTLQSKAWQLSGTYQIIYTKNTADIIDANGLRFIKLTTPVTTGYSWDGNQYFITGNSSSSSDENYAYEGWSYVYDSVNAAYTTKYDTYSNSLIVNEANTTLGNTGDFDPSLYQQKTYSQEVYAQNIGLIFQNTLFYIYQSGGISPGFDQTSFGIKMTRIQ